MSHLLSPHRPLPSPSWPLNPLQLATAGGGAGVDPVDAAAQACQQAMTGARRVASGWLALPFDALRAQYDAAVRLGWVRRSMLDAREVERTLGALEALALGSLARRV